MRLFTLSARRAATLHRIRRRAWLLIGLSLIGQAIAATSERAPITVGAPALAQQEDR